MFILKEKTYVEDEFFYLVTF